MHRQRVLIRRSFLDFGPFVLKPDFDLRLTEAKFLGQTLPPLLGQVPVTLKLVFQPVELLRGERRPGPLVLPAWGQCLLWFAGSRSLGGGGNEDINYILIHRLTMND